jgi:hypothetical protein
LTVLERSLDKTSAATLFLCCYERWRVCNLPDSQVTRVAAAMSEGAPQLLLKLWNLREVGAEECFAPACLSQVFTIYFVEKAFYMHIKNS